MPVSLATATAVATAAAAAAVIAVGVRVAAAAAAADAARAAAATAAGYRRIAPVRRQLDDGGGWIERDDYDGGRREEYDDVTVTKTATARRETN